MLLYSKKKKKMKKKWETVLASDSYPEGFLRLTWFMLIKQLQSVKFLSFKWFSLEWKCSEHSEGTISNWEEGGANRQDITQKSHTPPLTFNFPL